MTSLRIVMPVLDEGAALAGRLDALRPHRERGAELVVVDGGSTDETWAVAACRSDRLLLAPRGRGSQMNAGAQGARADVLLFLHADTALPADAGARIEQAVRQGAAWGRFDVRLDSTRPLLRAVATSMNLRSRLTGIATGDQAIFVRRDVFERAGGFADLPLMEDVALSATLRRQARPACIRSPVTTSARRWEANGIVRTIGLMWALRTLHALGADPQALADRYGYRRRPAACAAAIVVLAKAPVPGQAKTRLARSIGPVAAARAQRRFTIDTVRTALCARLGPVRLWCAPDTAHRFFRALQREPRLDLHAQPQGDLGPRLAAAAAHHFASTPGLPLLITGTDCPLLAPGHLQQAAASLASHDAVLIPALDGGYVLLGLRKPLPQVFDAVDWSTPQVLAQTRERLQAAGASWCELAPLWDVDDAGDWDRLRKLQAGERAG